MALTEITKVTGPGIHTLSNILSHNINSSGIITATEFDGKFSGNIVGTAATFSGNVTIGGTLTYEDVTNIDSVGIITGKGADINGDLDVDGHTNLDNVSIAGVSTFSDDVTFTTANGNNIYIDKSENSLKLGDSTYAKFGGAGELMMYHDGTYSVIKDTNSSPFNFEATGTITFAKAGLTETYAKMIPDGSVELYYNNVKSFETTPLGIKVPDSKRLSAGDGEDLKIYHNGSTNNFIAVTGGQVLTTNSDSLVFKNAANNETYANFTQNGAAELYYNGSKKFETTHMGGVLSGILTATSFSADSIIHTSDTDTKIRFPANNTVTVETAGSERLRITSAGKVGINVTNPTEMLHIKAEDNTDSFGGIIVYANNNSVYTKHGWRGLDSNEAVRFAISGTEKMRLTNGGKLALGRTSADEMLHITHDDNTDGFGGIKVAANNNSVYVKYGWRGIDGSADLRFGVADDEKVRIDSSGNVKINAALEALGGKVLIKNNVNYNTTDFDDNPTLYLLNGDQTTGVSEAAIVFAGRNTSGSTFRAAISGNGSTGLKFYTTSNTESDDTPAMLINGIGNIGIGEANPSSDVTFTVRKDVAAASGNASIQINNLYQGTANASNQSGAQIEFKFKNHNAAHNWWGGRILCYNSDNYNQYSYLRFDTASQGNAVERMRLNHDGDLTIFGKDNAELKLKCGTSTGNNVLAFLNSSGTTTGNITYDSDNNFLIFNVNQGEKVRITSAGTFGVGTINPDSNYKIDCNGVMRIGDGNAGKRIQFSRSGLGDELVLGVDGYGSNFSANDAVIQSSPTFGRPLIFGTNNQERLRIKSDGKIGINQSSPNWMLDIKNPNPGNDSKQQIQRWVSDGQNTLEFNMYGGNVDQCQFAATNSEQTISFLTGRNTGSQVVSTETSLLVTQNRDLWNQGPDTNPYGGGLFIGRSASPYGNLCALRDSNCRPILYMAGKYPEITLAHEVPTNGSHAAVLRFVTYVQSTNTATGQQFTIGTNGPGNYLDIGHANAAQNANSHGGISNFQGTTRFRVTTSGCQVFGTFSVSSTKNFKISHPLSTKTETHDLVHSSIEGPQADLIYRGVVDLVDGTATVNVDTAGRMTQGTFEALCTNVSCFTSNETDWTAVKGSVSGNILTIIAQDNTSTATVSWMVVGERKDQGMIDSPATDDNGRLITEPLKSS